MIETWRWRRRRRCQHIFWWTVAWATHTSKKDHVDSSDVLQLDRDKCANFATVGNWPYMKINSCVGSNHQGENRQFSRIILIEFSWNHWFALVLVSEVPVSILTGSFSCISVIYGHWLQRSWCLRISPCVLSLFTFCQHNKMHEFILERAAPNCTLPVSLFKIGTQAD